MVKIYRLTEVRSFNPLLSGEASYVSTFWAQHGAKQNGYPMTMVDFLKKKKMIHAHHTLSFMICVLFPSKNDLRELTLKCADMVEQ